MIKKLFFLIIFFLCILPNISLAVSDSIYVTAEVPALGLEIIGPNVYDVGSVSTKISVSTNKPALCTIFYGKTNSYGFTEKEDGYFEDHVFMLDNLESKTLYHFNISCIDQNELTAETGDHTFTTLESEIIPEEKKEEPIIPIMPEIQKQLESPLAEFLYILFTIMVAILTLLAILLPIIANLPLISIFDQLTAYFIWLDKKKWGIVYDSESKSPIPKVKVDLYDAGGKKLLKSQITNKKGEYGFSIGAGKYTLCVTKIDYSFPSEITSVDYHKEVIEVKKNSEPKIDIPVDADGKKMEMRLEVVGNLEKIVNYLRLPLLILGTFLSVWFYFNFPNTINSLVLGLYVVSWITLFYQLGQVYTLGNIFNVANDKVIGNTIIRAYDEKTGKLVATKISDANGHYALNINSGEYTLKATKDGFKPAEVENVKLVREKTISKTIYLKKLQ